jgi:hypothetical protein
VEFRAHIQRRCGGGEAGPCRTVDGCIKQILEEYKRGLKEPPKPPPPDPAEELLREYPELSVFGVEW